MQLSQISTTLKTLRRKQNLSLKQVAKRADTSIPALHRYENHWHRFELQTLEKLALALGTELVIQFKSPPKKRALVSDEIWQKLKPLFWDVKLSRNHLHKHRDWLIKRVLEYGTLEQVHLLIQLHPLSTIQTVFTQSQHQFTKKTQASWASFFNKWNPLCTLKSYQKEPKRFLNR